MDRRFVDVSDKLWELVAPVIPVHRKKTKKGRPRVPDRVCLAGMVYRARTGCHWKALPKDFGSGSTCHLRMTQWRKSGVFHAIFKRCVQFYDHEKGIDWRWTSLDASMVKAPKGGS